ncbi:hypothetical protein [Nitratiruptor sp. SB155-2]|uniref:hypothetical protein n=1 Tax=Nitratiruptor sp. (strain SB155-2) TaxID=387092 RepID=UPI0001587122|nr:hypothetical protein [Nitratiruptor sp. SB155-2]BAF70020.1 hypothetical protein NIS_0909 [Nitratiruptor sp. SB155-2]
MNIILISIFLVTGLFAKIEHFDVHNFNHKPFIRTKQKETLQEHVQINPVDITKKITGEKVEKKLLKHQNATIYFEIWTKHYYLWIDAQSGKVLKKEKR